MKAFRKLFGWLVTVVGWLGVVVCVAAVLGVWFVSYRVRSSVDRVVNKVTTFTVRVEERSNEAAGWVGESRQQVEDLERRLEEKVDALAEEGGIDPAELQELEENLRLLAQRVRDWREMAESTREFVGLFGEIIDSFGGVVGAEDREEVTGALADGLGQVGEAAGALEELIAALDETRLHEQAAEAGVQIGSRLLRFAGSLSALEECISTFADRVGVIGEATETLGQTINRRVSLGALLATILFAWQAVAQWCLARWGKALRRAESDE